MIVVKRNGDKVPFNKDKIYNAILKAYNEVNPTNDNVDDALSDCSKVCSNITAEKISVEQIQDIVENILMDSCKDVAKAYITYRYKRMLARKMNNTDNTILSLIDCTNEEIKEENSNKNSTLLPTQRDYMAGTVSKDLTDRLLLPNDIVEAHEQGIIHFHDADYFAQHMHNCFTGGTKFVTDKGVKAFREFKDGDKVYIKDKNGKLRLATVHKYGKQNMNKVIFSTGLMRREVICTPNHRWILSDGLVTTDLKIGDRLSPIVDSTDFNIDTLEEAEAFCIGFIIGDGADLKSNAVKIRLCGEKTKYSYIFKMAGYSEQNSSSVGNDKLFYRNNAIKQDFINGKGWRYMTPELKALAFKGYYSADGAKNSNRLSTSDERLCSFIEEVSCLAGYYISSKKIEIRDTPYKKDAKLFSYHFVVKQPKNQLWKVIDIKPYRHGEVDAWCVEEPITHSFTLEGGIVTGNCDLVNLEDMLQNGTVISETMIEKPHSFATACTITTQIIAQVASNQYGGQSVSLSALAPFVDISRKKIRQQFINDGLTVSDEVIENRVLDEVKRGVQTIQYQIVTLMTTNGQSPFVTIFMYLGEVQDKQTKHDLALIIEEVLKQRYQGVKNEVGVWITPAFPKLIYVLEEDNIHENSPYWYLTKLAAKCTAKRLVPDYISEKVMKQLKDGHCFTSMGCRSFLSPWKDENGNYKFYGRFNKGVVTINLVDVALTAKKNSPNDIMTEFWKIFDERLELCHRALICRYERLKGTSSDVAPILWQYGALTRLKKGEVIDKCLTGGYSSISLGYAGLWECVYALTGHKLTEKIGQDIGKNIMKHMNDKCKEWDRELNLGFSIYGTPLESTTYKFAKCLQKRFGVINGVTDKNYITNSYHIHVTEPIDAFTKLSIESEFQSLSTGGAISYVETSNLGNNIEAVLEVIKFIYDHIMYAELNTKSDYCQVCGFDGEIQIIEDKKTGKLVWECPNCGNRDEKKLNVARRTCGYIGSNFWNQGRTQEIKERVIHLGDDE